MPGGPIGGLPSARSLPTSGGPIGGLTPPWPGGPRSPFLSMPGGPPGGNMRSRTAHGDGFEEAMHAHEGPFHYQRMMQGNCGPGYFSKLWEDELRADLKEDAMGTALDHWRKFGEGHSRVGGRVNLSLVDAPTDLISKAKGAYTDYRMTTRHLDGGDDPLYSIKQYWEIQKPPEKHIHLVAGGLEHVHLQAGDLKEEVKHEKEFELSQGWLHRNKKTLSHTTARLESGAHLPPEGRVWRLVVPKLLKGEQLGLEVHGVIVTKITDKKAKQYGWVVGDQILKINGRIVSNNLDFQERMEHAVAVLRDTERPIVFEVWREIPHAMGGTWAEHMGHRFAEPQSILSQQLAPKVPPQLQVAHLEYENQMLRERLRQEQAILPQQAPLLPPQAHPLHRGPFPPHPHGMMPTAGGSSWNSCLEERDQAPLDMATQWLSGSVF